MAVEEQVYIEDIAPGLEIPALVKRCDPRRLVMWAAASGDFYEIHYDIEYARSVGLPGIVVHGALKNAFLGQLLHDWVAPLGSVLSFGCSYRGLDYPGEDLVCRGVVRDISHQTVQHIAELDVWIENAAREVTTPGTAAVALPSREERRSNGTP